MTHPSSHVVIALAGQGWAGLVDATGEPWRGGLVVRAADVIARHRAALPEGPMGRRDAAGATLAWIDRELSAGRAVAGALSYELGAALEGVGPASGVATGPDARLVSFPPTALRPWRPRAPLRQTRAIAGTPPRTPAPSTPPPRAGPTLPDTLTVQEARYLAGVRAARERIAEGRYYQLNLAVRFAVPAPPWLRAEPLHRALARVCGPQPVPYAMAIEGTEDRLLSLSMERFVSVDRAGRVTTRPIKGTAPRSADRAQDQRFRERMVASAKERAENTMIVDMARNDLARVAEVGSVRVPTLLTAVPYRTLWHLESEVHATLRPGLRASAWLQATLPPASVTGCPKVAAMQAIASLESRPRGAYCGALGVWLPDGSATLSVGIRQVEVVGERAWLSVGSGIVADSQPDAEWRETCLKADATLRGLAGEGAATASSTATAGGAARPRDAGAAPAWSTARGPAGRAPGTSGRRTS